MIEIEMQEFGRNVLTAVREKADGTFSAWLVEKGKNNGILKTGIAVSCQNGVIATCIYLDDYFACYQKKEMDVQEIAEEICRAVIGKQGYLPELNVVDFLRWESIRDKIYAKLVNTERNRKLLRQVPSRPFLDLSAVYYVCVGITAECREIILINNEHMKLWNQDEDSLYRTACENRKEEGEPVWEDMRDVFRDYLGDRPGEADCADAAWNRKMYILTNRKKVWGAIEITDADALERIAAQIGDFIVLPSSVHETIVIPDDKSHDYGRLVEMVCEVNERFVMPEEVLSNHVYTYSMASGALTIAA